MSRASQKPLERELELYLEKIATDVQTRRLAMGLTQEKFAEKVGIPPGAVRDIEQAYDGRITHHKKTADFLSLPFGYGVSDDVIGLIRGLHGDLCERIDQLGERIDQLAQRMNQLSTRVEHVEDAMHFQRRVTRREFNNSSSLAMLGALIPEPIRGFFTESGFPTLSVNDVEAMQAYCDDLDMQCRAFGGGTVFDMTVDMDRKAMRWLSEGRYSGKVKDELAVLCAKLKASAGWLAFDTERLGLAERFLNDAIAYARIVGSVQVEILALNNLCALLNRQGRYHQALRVAEAGLYLSPFEASRTRAIFHIRRLSTCGQQGDEGGLEKELAAARYQYELGRNDSDQGWSNWGQHAVTSEAGKAYVELGLPKKGEGLLRSIVGGADVVGGHYAELRNAVSISRALAQQGGAAEASEYALAILPAVLEFQSARLQRKVHELYTLLVDHRGISKVNEFIDVYDEATGKLA